MQRNNTRIISPHQLRDISNYISSKQGAKLTSRELEELVAIIRNSDPDNMPNKKAEVLEYFYQRFIDRDLPSSKPFNNIKDRLHRVYGLDSDNLLKSFQDKEFRSLSSKENPIAYTANNNREGRTSLWTNITPYELTMEAEKQDPLDKLNTTLDKICNFFAPSSIDIAPKNTTTNWITYNSIALNSRQFALDSRFRDLNDPKRYRWDLNISANVGAQGTIRSKDTLQIKMLRGFHISLPYCSDTTIISRSLKLNIRQFSNGAYSHDLIMDNSGMWRNYNLSYFIESYDGARLIAIPNPATFAFDLPLPTFNGFDVEFYQPDGILCMPEDYVIMAITPAANTIFTFANHNLNAGDIIYINDFNSDSDTINSQMNNYNGIAVLTILNPNQFTVQVDTTAITIYTTNIHVYIGKYRFIIDLEMLCMG